MDSGTVIFLVVAGLAAVGIVVFNLLRLRAATPSGSDAIAEETLDDEPETERQPQEDEPEDDDRAPRVGAFAPGPGWALPPPPAGFVGRYAELALLRTAVEEEGAAACVLRGRAGSGKTALALELAAELAPRYPDAQVFVDLQGQSQAPGAAVGLRALVAALSPGTRPSRHPARLAGQLRALLTGRRALLVVDAAPAGSGLEGYIPVPGCLLLVTSRDFSFAGGAGVVTETLRELPAEDARALLLRLAPRAGQHAPALAELCDGLPLALCLIGAGLADRFGLTTPAACEESLAAARRGREAVEAAVQVRWDFLAEEKRRLLATLTVMPQSFDADAAAAVLERDAQATEETLDELVRGGLLEKLGARYRLAGPVAERADKALDDAGWEAASERHAGHFARLLEESGPPGSGESAPPALARFQREWGHFRAAQRWAAVRTPENAAAARLCSVLGEAGLPWLEVYHPEEATAWAEAALAASRTSGDLGAQGHHLVTLGRLYQEQSGRELDPRVIPTWDEAVALARQLSDRELEMEALDHLANVQGDPEDAIPIHEKALELAQQLGDEKSAGLFLSSLAAHQAARGEGGQALELYGKALDLALRNEDREAESLVRWNLALAHEAEGEAAPAREHLEILAGQARQAGDAEAERACRKALARLRQPARQEALEE